MNDPTTSFPLLYAPCDSSDEEELSGQHEIKTGELDAGDDLTDGILAVDGARFLLSTVRNEVKGMKFLALRGCLLNLIDGWRAFLKSRL